MKVLVFSDLWLPFPGGAERYIANVSYELQKRGHTIDVLTSYERFRDERVPVVFQDVGVAERHPIGAAVLQAAIQRVDPDVLLTHHFFAFEFTKELQAAQLPLVQLVYNNVRLPFADLAVYISSYTFAHSGGRNGDLIIHPPAYSDIVASSHGQKIGFIKPIHHKGADYVYRLAAQLPHRQFLILRGEWGNEDIREMPNVEFMTPVYDMRDFYQHCYLMLMPSWNEDAGTVPQEATLNGLPCISTDIMGLSETNVAGIRLERHEHLWINAIERLYDDPTVYQAVVARQIAQLAVFAWDQKFDDLSHRIQVLGDRS